MDLKLFNTLSKQKDVFKTVDDKQVKMYVCGPTVYGLLHVGNFRGAIFFNLVRNWLEHLGYNVTYVYNYTDVDDKIIKKANEENVDSLVISERYISEFEKDFSRLGLKKHDHNPKVTEYMPQIVDFVDDLVKKEKAYVIDGEVFYRIDSFSDYGKLSGKKLDDLEAGQRVEVDKRKENPFDFVLWKPSKDGEPSWDSPWGKGRPGWHIECSAMIQSILGETIDIHGGGIDLIFPHHENEIAQGEGRTEKPYCNHWMHNAFINMGDEKMSKSLGNIVTGRDFMEKWHPEILKFMILSSHYRAPLNLGVDRVHQSIGGLARIYSSLKDANFVIENGASSGGSENKKLTQAISKANSQIEKAMNDDFNTVEFMAQIFEVVRLYNSLNLSKKLKDSNSAPTAKIFREWIKENGSMMALFSHDASDFLTELDQILIRENDIDVSVVEKLIHERIAAREEKNWARSDEIRDELEKMNIVVHDGNEKTTWEVKK